MDDVGTPMSNEVLGISRNGDYLLLFIFKFLPLVKRARGAEVVWNWSGDW